MTMALPNEGGINIQAFVGSGSNYYVRQFSRLEHAVRFTWSLNIASAILGPIWAAGRRLWGWAFAVTVIELVVVALLSAGIYGPVGEAELAQANRLAQAATSRAAEAEQARHSNAANASVLETSALALKAAADDAKKKADDIVAGRSQLVIEALLLLCLSRIGQGFAANWLLHRRFQRWQINPSNHARVDWPLAATSTIAILALYSVAAIRFGSHSAPDWLRTFPAVATWRDASADTVNSWLESFTKLGAPLFVGINYTVQVLLNLLELLFITAPWPLVAFAILFVAVRRLGWRAAVWIGAGLAYIGLLGFWNESMESIALLGTAAIICVTLGLPLGIWCGKSARVYGICKPVLDLMQTMPTFVYLIPVIAFFGIGKVPAVIATVIAGVPPLVRMAAVGVQTVPSTTREAAFAYGGSNWYVVLKVDLPLAAAAIKVGINQAVLTCLSMVVVASLIGAKGLGDDILHAISYAASGLGILAGMAILICAMIMDRIAQGRSVKVNVN